MKLQNISKSYGDNIVFENFNLEVEENKILALLGASGCGKTTLLNIISGVVDYEGTVTKCGERVSYLFQKQRLIPNLTVYKNLEYVLKSLYDGKGREEKIEAILKQVEMWDYKNAYPSELSGGMGRRVSLARAFVYDAPLLLMDEPFKGLDISLKKRIIEVFTELYLADKRTTVFVTHDIDDALLLADRIVVLQKGGEIIADEILDKPIKEREIGDLGDLKNRIYGIL